MQYIERAEPGAQVSLARDLYEVLDILEKKPDQDLVLLDLRMPGMNGMEGFKTIKSRYPRTPVALMSGIAESNDVRAAISMGAVGYFPKTLSGKALLQGIQLVLSGEKFVPMDNKTNQIMPSYYTGTVKTAAQGPSRKPIVNAGSKVSNAPIRLTPREEEVLSFLLRGDSNKDIANALGLQVVTVKLHVRGVCRKLNAKNRTQAALRARELGLV